MSKQQSKKTSLEAIHSHIERLDKISEDHDIDIGYKHFCGHADSLIATAKEAGLEFKCTEEELAGGNIYVNLSKNVLQMQSGMVTTYINFMLLKRYMEEKGIQSIQLSENITVDLETFERSEMIQDCIRVIESIDPKTLEFEDVERKLIESSTDSKSEG